MKERVEGRTADIIRGTHTTTCPFCSVATGFAFAYDGLVVEYRSKCPHVYEVTRDFGPVMVMYRCIEGSSSLASTAA